MPERPEIVMYKNWHPCEVTVKLRPLREEHRYVDLEGISDPLDLADVACSHCRRSGTLTREWPDGETMRPHCKCRCVVLIGFWMT
jgi:hypothetical protein